MDLVVAGADDADDIECEDEFVLRVWNGNGWLRPIRAYAGQCGPYAFAVGD